MSRIPKNDVLDVEGISKLLSANREKVALGSLGLGAAASVVDNEDDDLLSSAGKTIKAGVLGAGAAYGAEHLLKTQTVQDMVRGEVTEVAKTALKTENQERRIKNAGGKLGVAMRIGLGVVAGATVLDIAARASDSIGAESMKFQQEQNLKERVQKKKEKAEKQSYGHLETSDIVFDLFDARSGHHKMGNAKFN